MGPGGPMPLWGTRSSVKAGLLCRKGFPTTQKSLLGPCPCSSSCSCLSFPQENQTCLHLPDPRSKSWREQGWGQARACPWAGLARGCPRGAKMRQNLPRAWPEPAGTGAAPPGAGCKINHPRGPAGHLAQVCCWPGRSWVSPAVTGLLQPLSPPPEAPAVAETQQTRCTSGSHCRTCPTAPHALLQPVNVPHAGCCRDEGSRMPREGSVPPGVTQS